MFSKRMMVTVGAMVLIVLYLMVFSFAYLRKSSIEDAATRTALLFAAPFQATFSHSIGFIEDIWTHYFYLVSVSKENNALKNALAACREQNNACQETAMANARLRALVGLKEKSPYQMSAAEVIAKDPSPWYKTVVINKGTDDGVAAGFPVVVPEGVAGYVVSAGKNNAKVLLIIDRNSAVDALVQRTRARGLVQGMAGGVAGGVAGGLCRFDYALRKLDIRVGDTVVTSGFDGIYPKGFRIGSISKIVRRNAGLFQEVEVTPYADFTKIEEVMILHTRSLDGEGDALNKTDTAE
jgi:rod shape-determining protein MreC